MPAGEENMHSPKYALFFDNHTMAASNDVGSDFDADEFGKRIKDCGVDFVGFPAKCNQGFCYYDTNIGIRHPSLKRDMFGDLVNSCIEKGVAVSAYLNCGLSHEDAVRHPEWNTVSPDGRTLHPDIYDLGWVSPYIRTMCLNSPYRDYLVVLLSEVAQKYPVAGFLLDSFNGFPCVCPVCVGEMRKRAINWRDQHEIERFAHDSAVRLAEDIARTLRGISPDFLLYFLGLNARDNVRLGSYLECECLPTYPCWGYDYLPIMSHHLRTLTKDNRPILNMTGRFYEWGDFGSIRPQAAIEYDVLYGIANGMRPNIGGHIHPRGSTQPAIFDRIQSIFSTMQRNEEWYTDAKNLVDIGVLCVSNVEKSPELIGATRMLSELKMQFDIIYPEADLERYRLLVLPDTMVLTPLQAGSIRKYLASGRAVIATGCSGLNVEKNAFALGAEWGITYLGESLFEPAFFKPLAPFQKYFPDIPLALYKKGIEVKTQRGTETTAVVCKPYYNREWDGVYANFYIPPDRITDSPVVTIHDNVAHITHPIFSAYHALASVELRTLLKIVIERLLPEPLVRVHGLPSFGKVHVTAQKERRMVHLINYVPELRGKSEIVEERLPAVDLSVSLRLDGNNPSRAFLAPECTPLQCKIGADYAEVKIDRICGYQLVVFDN